MALPFDQSGHHKKEGGHRAVCFVEGRRSSPVTGGDWSKWQWQCGAPKSMIDQAAVLAGSIYPELLPAHNHHSHHALARMAVYIASPPPATITPVCNMMIVHDWIRCLQVYVPPGTDRAL